MNLGCNNIIHPLFELTPYEAFQDNFWVPKGASKKTSNSKILIPRPYRILRDIRKISTCIHHNAAIDNNAVLWEWGADSMAQMDGVYSNDFPQNVQRLPQRSMENVLNVCCGGWHTLCITKDKKLWSWGNNEYGQLGLGDYLRRDHPAFIMDGVDFIFASEFQSFAIREDHTLWGWGNNESKMLLEESECCCTPKILMDNVDKISCGSHVIAAVRQDGTLWAWGTNTNNIIFTKPQHHFCPPLLLMTGVIDISFPASENSEYGLVIAENGDLYCLGNLTYQSQRTIKLSKEQKNMPLKLMNNIFSAYLLFRKSHMRISIPPNAI